MLQHIIVSCWHGADVKLRPLFSGYWVESGYHWLIMSISAFDPERTFAFVDVSNIAQTPLRQDAQAAKRHQDRVPPRPHLCTCAILIRSRERRRATISSSLPSGEYQLYW